MNPPAKQETQFQSLSQEDPLEKGIFSREWQPNPIFFTGKSHGQRSLTGYSPWGLKRIRDDLETKQQPQ